MLKCMDSIVHRIEKVLFLHTGHPCVRYCAYRPILRRCRCERSFFQLSCMQWTWCFITHRRTYKSLQLSMSPSGRCCLRASALDSRAHWWRRIFSLMAACLLAIVAFRASSPFSASFFSASLFKLIVLSVRQLWITHYLSSFPYQSWSPRRLSWLWYLLFQAFVTFSCRLLILTVAES